MSIWDCIAVCFIVSGVAFVLWLVFREKVTLSAPVIGKFACFVCDDCADALDGYGCPCTFETTITCDEPIVCPFSGEECEWDRVEQEEGE